MHHHLELGALSALFAADPLALLEGITRAMGQKPAMARAFPLPGNGMAGAWLRGELQIVYRVWPQQNALTLDLYARQAFDLTDALERLESLFQASLPRPI